MSSTTLLFAETTLPELKLSAGDGSASWQATLHAGDGLLLVRAPLEVLEDFGHSVKLRGRAHVPGLAYGIAVWQVIWHRGEPKSAIGLVQGVGPCPPHVVYINDPYSRGPASQVLIGTLTFTWNPEWDPLQPTRFPFPL
jgi:hypothetical protein